MGNMNVRQFRTDLTKVDEVTEVTNRGEKIGKWTPYRDGQPIEGDYQAAPETRTGAPETGTYRKPQMVAREIEVRDPIVDPTRMTQQRMDAMQRGGRPSRARR